MEGKIEQGNLRELFGRGGFYEFINHRRADGIDEVDEKLEQKNDEEE